MQASKLFDAHGASRARSNGKDPNWSESKHEMCDPRQGTDEYRKVVDESIFGLDADEGHAYQDAEQNNRWHDVVGQGVKRVGRNVELQEIDILHSLNQSRTEEGSRLPGGKGKRECEHQN